MNNTNKTTKPTSSRFQPTEDGVFRRIWCIQSCRSLQAKEGDTTQDEQMITWPRRRWSYLHVICGN